MRRKVWLFFVCGLVLPLVVAATASAQGATMVVTPKSARPGDVVNVRSFNGGFVTAAGTSNVVIRLATRKGRELRTAPVDPRGNINVDVPLPGDLQPGWHLLLGTQTIEVNDRQRSFTPGRTRLRITAASAGSAAPGGRGGSPDSPLGLLAMGSALILLVTGAALTARKLRTLNRPPLGS
jgi:hypothetical protein